MLDVRRQNYFPIYDSLNTSVAPVPTIGNTRILPNMGEVPPRQAPMYT